MEPGFTVHAEGSLPRSASAIPACWCTASVEERIPPWLRGKGEGWVTAEYGMLPRATHARLREAAKGKQSGRTQEIQRADRPLAARRDSTSSCSASARSRSIATCIQADGGTRTASISAAPGWRCASRSTSCWPTGTLTTDPILTQGRRRLTAASIEGKPVLDLDYIEDSAADADAELRASARRRQHRRSAGNRSKARPMTRKRLLRLLRLARIGCSADLRRAVDGAPGAAKGRQSDRVRKGNASSRPWQAGDRQPLMKARCARSRRCWAIWRGSRSRPDGSTCLSPKKPARPSRRMRGSRRWLLPRLDTGSGRR